MIANLINEDKIHMEQNNIDNYAHIHASQYICVLSLAIQMVRYAMV